MFLDMDQPKPANNVFIFTKNAKTNSKDFEIGEIYRVKLF